MMVVMIVPAFRPASGFPFYQRNDELARFGRFAGNKVRAVKPHHVSRFQFVFSPSFNSKTTRPLLMVNKTSCPGWLCRFISLPAASFLRTTT